MMLNELERAQLEELFGVLSPRFFGKAYAAALKKHDLSGAADAVGKYFKKRRSMDLRPLPKLTDAVLETAERAVRGHITEVNVPYAFPGGKIDFLFNPTVANPPMNPEWQWQLNRMSFWLSMASAYAATKDERFAIAFQAQMRHWIASLPCTEDWNGCGSAWRTIETGLRLMGSWTAAFETFRKSPSVTPQSVALMAASMHRQALHAMAHRTGHNWLAMEMNGVYTFASLFPEMKDSAKLRRKSAKILGREIRRQLLPDGFQNELSPDYHLVVYRCGSAMLNIALKTGHTEELPDDFSANLEKAAAASLATLTPALTFPRTNDCFTIPAASIFDSASALFPRRKDFLWAASNREKGTLPRKKTSSRFLPYAGFALMRSGWDENAAYCCFDVGPLGKAHRHQDKLNLNLWKGSVELIFDDGGGQYEDSDYRRYAVSAWDHNVAAVDGLPQFRKNPQIAKRPISVKWTSEPEFDYVCGTYRDGYGESSLKLAAHKREILFVKPDLFIVSDTLTSLDRQEHRYELRFHTDSTKVRQSRKYPGALIADLGQAWDLLLIPASGNVKVSLRSAENPPERGGWYVARNDKTLHPASTIVLEAGPCRKTRLFTLLFPLKHGTETMSARYEEILQAVRKWTSGTRITDAVPGLRKMKK